MAVRTINDKNSEISKMNLYYLLVSILFAAEAKSGKIYFEWNANCTNVPLQGYIFITDSLKVLCFRSEGA